MLFYIGDSRVREKSGKLTSIVVTYLDLISSVQLSPQIEVICDAQEHVSTPWRRKKCECTRKFKCVSLDKLRGTGDVRVKRRGSRVPGDGIARQAACRKQNYNLIGSLCPEPLRARYLAQPPSEFPPIYELNLLPFFFYIFYFLFFLFFLLSTDLSFILLLFLLFYFYSLWCLYIYFNNL